MLFHHIHQLRKFAEGVKNLALPVYDILLKVYCHRLGNAEVFHSVGDGDAQLLTEAEEMVYGKLAGEDYGRERRNVYALLAKSLGINALNLDEREEIYRHSVRVG